MTQSKRILVVEDSQINIEILTQILRQNNYEILVCETGEEAIAKYESYSPELILLDIILPKMDGFSVCTKIKENPKYKDIPIMFLTGLTKGEDIAKGFELGAVDFVTKPFNASEVIARIRTHLLLQESMRRYQDEKETAVSATQLKDKFLSLVAHDMRGPLTNIQLYVEMFKEHVPTEKQKYVTTCETTITHLTELLNTLLNLNKFQSGKITLDKKMVPLKGLVEKHFEHFALTSQNKKIKLINDVDVTSTIFADSTFIGEVISNFISNSIKFCKENDEVKVSFNKDACELSIADTGPGIPLEVAKAIKQTGFTKSTKGSGGEKGHGLGLSLAYEIIKAHGGDLEIHGVQGKGSTFTIRFPF